MTTSSTGSKKGRLFLIPSPLGDGPVTDVIPGGVLDAIKGIGVFVVEEERTVRRYLSAAGLKGHIQDLEFHTLNEHTPEQEAKSLVRLLDGGRDVGLVSEAGLPAVADPGALLVEACQEEGIEVIPLCGPSSLMMALMASGLNGQKFAFKGYLPQKKEDRRKVLSQIEKRSLSEKETQIFIETPYRNDSLLEDILQVCKGSTRLTIAKAITTPQQSIRTKSVAKWKSDRPVIGKTPCVFLLQA